MLVSSFQRYSGLFVVGLMIGSAIPARAEIIEAKVATAITVIRQLERPGQDKLATVWDNNKYIQCRLQNDRTLRCEAAGALMQISMARVLTAAHIDRLMALGWVLDPSFGNYVQTFPADASAIDIAQQILTALSDGYGADLKNLDISTQSIPSEPCPPRNGPSQNLAGSINNAPSMAASAVHACAYVPSHTKAMTAAETITHYGPMVTAEITRLRVNLHDYRVFTVFVADGGYVQCRPRTEPDALYCEAESEDSSPKLAAVLTPERIARLHVAGFKDPGDAQNYSKIYPLDDVDDATLAAELLGLLHDVYDYDGLKDLKVNTEDGYPVKKPVQGKKKPSTGP